MRNAVTRVRFVVALATAALASNCNFDTAFDRYCANNPRCPADASPPEAKPEVVPDVVQDAAPEPGPEVAPDVPADAPPEVGPDAHPDLFPYWLQDGFSAPRPPDPPKNCTSAVDCSGSEICHPTGRVCVPTCRSRSDCPPWLDNCVDLLDQSGGGRTNKVCSCSGAPVCERGAPGLGYRCNPVDGLCEQSCSSSDDCTGFQPSRSCDQFLTVCIPTCSSNADCPSTVPRCDSSSSRCIGCQSNTDCGNRSDGRSVCSSTGACTTPSPSP